MNMGISGPKFNLGGNKKQNNKQSKFEKRKAKHERIDEQIASGDTAGLTLGQINKSQARSSSAQAAEMTGEFSSILESIGEVPELGDVEKGELSLFEETQGRILQNAQLNASNFLKNAMSGLGRGLEGSGINRQGAFSANLASGMTSQAQGQLNDLASQQAMQLNQFRQSLRAGVNQRVLNKANAMMGMQGQLTGQAQGYQQFLTNRDLSNQMLGMQAQGQESQESQALWGGAASLFGSVAGPVISGLFTK